MKRHFRPLLLTLVSLTASACGYTLRDSDLKSPVIESSGIRKVYITPLVNNSYKAGVEILVYNALIKRISSQSEVKIVGHAADADAIITGAVNSADYSPVSYTAGSNLEPKSLGGGFKNTVIASVYSAALGCSFSLTTVDRPGTPFKKKSWNVSFGRSKSFPGNNQLGVVGTTSAIINDSEFERALGDIAESMMTDVHEALLGMF